MGINRNTLIELTLAGMQTSLEKHGYHFEQSAFPGWVLGFSKYDARLGLSLYLLLQPSGLSADDISTLTVNLIRNNSLDPLELSSDQHDPIEKFIVQMSELVTKGVAPDHACRWRFSDESQAKTALKDVLDKLEGQAIPFLEDPNSSYDDLIIHPHYLHTSYHY